MGKVVNLNGKKGRKNSLLSSLVRGTPFEFNIFGKTVQIMSVPYLIKKRKEFFNNYWSHFTEGLNNIDSNKEFNPSNTINKYNSLSSEMQAKVLWDCSEIYAFNDKLTYSDFIKVVNSYCPKGLDLDFGPGAA